MSTKMNGADAILRSLEAEGVEVAFGLPGGAILPTYDAIARGTRPPCPRPPRAGRRPHGRGLRSGLGRVGVAFATSGPGATNLSRRSRTPGWTRRRSSASRARCDPADRHGRLPGVRHHRRHDPIVKHSWRVEDVDELQRDAGGVPCRQDRPLRARARRRPAGHPGGRARLQLPRGGRPARAAATVRGHARQIAEAAARIAAAERPVSTRRRHLNADACAELLEVAEAGRLPVITTLMGKGALPETHELTSAGRACTGPSGRTGP